MPYFENVCDWCKQPFRAYRGPSHAKRNPPRFCSKACHAKGWAKARDFVCEGCGKTFQARVTEDRPNPRFCSRACHKQVVTSMVDVTCQTCGKVFRTQSSHNRSYCSRACSGRYSALSLQKTRGNPNTERACRQCGTLLKRKQKSGGRVFCSKTCWKVWAVEQATRRVKEKGEDAGYRGPNWTHQRRNARMRDNYTCQRCGIAEADCDRQLSVHHIVPFAEFGIDYYKAANALSNLVTLCAPCHCFAEANRWEPPLK